MKKYHRSPLSRPGRAVTMLALLALLALSACAAPQASAPTKLTVCQSAAATAQSSLFYAQEKGIFKKHGLDVNTMFIESGSAAVTALIAGQADVCAIAGAPVVNAALAGADTIMVGGLVNSPVYTLMVAPNIKTADDLKGKALAVSRAGSGSDSAIRQILQVLKLTPGKDVTILAVGGQAERLAAVQAGAVVGSVFSPPETVEARESGMHVLVDMADLKIPLQQSGIGTTKRFVASNRAAVVSFMKAIAEATASMKRDKAGTMEVIAKALKLDPVKDVASLEETYEAVVKRYFPKVPYPTVEGLQTELDTAAKTNPAAAGVKAESLVDLSIVNEIEQSGFIDAVNK